MASERSSDLFGGVRVIELAEWVFVPVAGVMLADWGAEVIKIEHPIRGDGYRSLVSAGLHTVDTSGVNQAVELANRGKRSIGLDITADEGRELLLELLATADVFLTNFLPSTLKRVRLTVEDVQRANPSIIYARGHGQGTRGPDADRPSYDSTSFWARGALGESLRVPGQDHPVEGRYAVGDRNAATQLAFGIAAALFRRQRTGEPAVIDVSLLATAIWTLGSDMVSVLQGNADAAFVAADPRERPNPLVNTYATQDGRFLHIAFLRTGTWWPELARAIGRPELAEDPRFADHQSLMTNKVELVETLQAVFATRTLAEWRQVFSGERFPWSPFQRLTEIPDDPQVVANGYIGTVEVDGGQAFRIPTGAVQVDERPPSLRRAPELGQDTEVILLELGYEWERISQFKDAGIIIN